jgi:hypothetical protein
MTSAPKNGKHLAELVLEVRKFKLEKKEKVIPAAIFGILEYYKDSMAVRKLSVKKSTLFDFTGETVVNHEADTFIEHGTTINPSGTFIENYGTKLTKKKELKFAASTPNLSTKQEITEKIKTQEKSPQR